jgi:hypothetical protein
MKFHQGSIAGNQKLINNSGAIGYNIFRFNATCCFYIGEIYFLAIIDDYFTAVGQDYVFKNNIL